MKVLLLNTSDNKGGASIAVYRLLNAFTSNRIEASMLVLHKSRQNDTRIFTLNTTALKYLINKIRFLIERIVIYLLSKGDRANLFKVSIANTGTDICKHPLVVEADIIHLHWINQGFLSLSDIKKLAKTGKPVVWTMHDMWLMTGICHYSWGCDNFKEMCGYCPFLHSDKKEDISYHTLCNKLFLSESNVHLVAVSSWLKGMADSSKIARGLHTSVIPNVIDISVFQPADKVFSRKKLSLPLDKDIMLMGAAKLNDPIKGFDYLIQALSILKQRKQNLLLILFGEIKNDPTFLSMLPVDYLYMGTLSNMETIAQLYAAADVTVVPSSYETFGQTLIESMACGCPVVSFDNSGQTDIIDHKRNGYLAKYQDIEDLADGLNWVLDNNMTGQLSTECIKKVHDNYTESIVASQYIALYNELLNKPKA